MENFPSSVLGFSLHPGTAAGGWGWWWWYVPIVSHHQPKPESPVTKRVISFIDCLPSAKAATVRTGDELTLQFETLWWCWRGVC